MFATMRLLDTAKPAPLLPTEVHDVFMVLPESDRVGVLRLLGSVLNDRWLRMLDAMPDGFVVVDTSFTNKVVVQRVSDGPAPDREIDVAVWGAEWIAFLTGGRPEGPG